MNVVNTVSTHLHSISLKHPAEKRLVCQRPHYQPNHGGVSYVRGGQAGHQDQEEDRARHDCGLCGQGEGGAPETDGRSA